MNPFLPSNDSDETTSLSLDLGETCPDHQGEHLIS